MPEFYSFLNFYEASRFVPSIDGPPLTDTTDKENKEKRLCPSVRPFFRLLYGVWHSVVWLASKARDPIASRPLIFLVVIVVVNLIWMIKCKVGNLFIEWQYAPIN